MIIEQIQEAFAKAIQAAYPQLETLHLEVTQATNETFGDYQCNSALKLAKPLQKSPREVASEIVAHLSEEATSLFSVEIQGPGFINIRLAHPFLVEHLTKMAHDPRLGVKDVQKKEKVLVEFSSPNTAKEMHVGHLRSTILGESLARVLEFLGYEVLRINHIGDWGTQFGMLIHYIKTKCTDFLEEKREASLSDLMHWYREAKLAFDQEETFRSASQREVVALQGGDLVNKKLWERICQISRRGYQEIYDLLDIRLQEVGESFYNQMLPQVVEDLENKGLVEVSEGAKCVFVEEYKNRQGTSQPLMVQKSDGGFNYDTTDLAAVKYRADTLGVDRILYVVDQGQALHFQLVFAVAKKAGYVDPKMTKLVHVPFGLVLGEDGKKFRTRSGKTEKLVDLLKEAEQRARALIEERTQELPEEEKQQLAKTLGLASVKYADLATHRQSDYQFSYDKMLRFEGNTAPYLLYAYVRGQSILHLSEKRPSETLCLNDPQERRLALHLLRFPEALACVEQEYTPHRLSEYLYLLAEHFHAFFRDCRVIGSEEEAERLLLVALVGRTLKKGLSLLGIETVERM